MSFKAWFKSKTADKVLAPLRHQMIKQFNKNDKVLEIGCGTGSLLLLVNNHINYGIGVDLDSSMVDFAKQSAKGQGITNINFTNTNIHDLTNIKDFNVITSTICLHEIPHEQVVLILKQFLDYPCRLIIADFYQCESVFAKISTEFDEFISGHYQQFRAYRKLGWMPYLAKASGFKIVNTLDTEFDGIKIWELAKN